VFGAIYTSPSTLHEASVNAIAWAPHEFGLALVRRVSVLWVSTTDVNSVTHTLLLVFQPLSQVDNKSKSLS
jgi:hypothetical protein